MRLDRTSLIAASDALLSAAALGSSWEDGLDTLARAAGCHSACVWASRGGRPSFVGNKNFYEQGTSRINKPGDIPYTDRILMCSSPDDGFITLDAHPEGKRVKRVPFYADVMTKCDFVRWAGYSLDPGDGSLLKVGLWRGDRDGLFEDEQIEVLNGATDSLKAAVTFARMRGDLIARERSSVYAAGGEPTFLLDKLGSAAPVNVEADSGRLDRPLRMRCGRLQATYDEETRCLDRIVGEAVGPDGRAGSTVLTSLQGDRYQFLAIPLRGQALDVFCSTRAIATLVRIGGPSTACMNGDAAALLKSGFDLTERETGVAVLVAAGMSPAAISLSLGIGEGTARNHLKAVLRKVGVHGQVELAALVARYH